MADRYIFAMHLIFQDDLWQSTNCVGETPDEHQDPNLDAMAGSYRPPGAPFRLPLIGLSVLSCASGTHNQLYPEWRKAQVHRLFIENTPAFVCSLGITLD
jgi:hypothetical protein